MNSTPWEENGKRWLKLEIVCLTAVGPFPQCWYHKDAPKIATLGYLMSFETSFKLVQIIESFPRPKTTHHVLSLCILMIYFSNIFMRWNSSWTNFFLIKVQMRWCSLSSRDSNPEMNFSYQRQQRKHGGFFLFLHSQDTQLCFCQTNLHDVCVLQVLESFLQVLDLVRQLLFVLQTLLQLCLPLF